jgi:hypothetical protein
MTITGSVFRQLQVEVPEASMLTAFLEGQRQFAGMRISDELSHWMGMYENTAQSVIVRSEQKFAYRLDQEFQNLDSMKPFSAAVILAILLKREQNRNDPETDYLEGATLFFPIQLNGVRRVAAVERRPDMEHGFVRSLAVIDHKDDEYEELRDVFFSLV